MRFRCSIFCHAAATNAASIGEAHLRWLNACKTTHLTTSDQETPLLNAVAQELPLASTGADTAVVTKKRSRQIHAGWRWCIEPLCRRVPSLQSTDAAVRPACARLGTNPDGKSNPPSPRILRHINVPKTRHRRSRVQLKLNDWSDGALQTTNAHMARMLGIGESALRRVPINRCACYIHVLKFRSWERLRQVTYCALTVTRSNLIRS